MARSRNTVRRILVPAIIFSALAAGGYVYRSHTNHLNYLSAISATKEWARLNDFPKSFKVINLEVLGSMFTREFVVTFKAPLDDIDKWLEESPGTANVTPSIDGSIRNYTIEPGGGAQHAELKVDEEAETVRIRVYWS